MSFVLQMMIADGGEVRYVTGVEKGKPAWYFIRLYPERYQDYKKCLKKPSFALKEYGEILRSGWGEEAPEDVLAEMRERYKVNT